MLQRLHEGIERERKKLALVARYAALGLLTNPEELEEEKSSVDEAAAAFGLVPVYEHQQAEPVYLWPENVQAWNFFQAVLTQWNVGPNGAIGLDYAGVAVVRDAWCIRRKHWPKLFSAVQSMERATLNAWKERVK